MLAGMLAHDQVGVTAAGPARTKTPKTTSAGAKIEQSNSESCRSVAARTYCENYEQVGATPCVEQHHVVIPSVV